MNRYFGRKVIIGVLDSFSRKGTSKQPVCKSINWSRKCRLTLIGALFVSSPPPQIMHPQHEIRSEIIRKIHSFLESLDRIADPNYWPTDKDVLLSRMPTAGVYEVQFPYKDKIFRYQYSASAYKFVSLKGLVGHTSHRKQAAGSSTWAASAASGASGCTASRT